MVDTAAHATRGVKYPTRKQTRQAIITTFKKQMNALKDRLNVRYDFLFFRLFTNPRLLQ
jgi:hypothetical protein